jgi:hypothetical protein
MAFQNPPPQWGSGSVFFCVVMGVQGDATYENYGQLKGCNFVIKYKKETKWVTFIYC